ncbi:MAG: PilW family protein [Planctomycetota bacterium]
MSSPKPSVSNSALPRRAFTLVEVLIATFLTLLLMAAVAEIFSRIGTSINDSRATLEMADRMRSTATRLQLDLAGLTATPLPPQNPADNPGYLEIVEGRWVVRQNQNGTFHEEVAPLPEPIDNDNSNRRDTTVIDNDDILLFTTRSAGRPFIGRAAGATIESDVAEIAWFVRGRTLYRRVLLVAPTAVPSGTSATGFYRNYDVSVRRAPTGSSVVGNTLGDLTKRENRFAHATSAFPYDIRGWGQLRLPLLQECSDPAWEVGVTQPSAMTYTPQNQVDLWLKPHPWETAGGVAEVDPDTGVHLDFPNGTRFAEDVILTNVIGFDVKVFEPALGRYVDLGYDHNNAQLQSELGYDPANPPAGALKPLFYRRGSADSSLQAAATEARIYDTWSTHYREMWPGSGAALLNGMDDDNDGIVDNDSEFLALAEKPFPPYPAPLRGIQVKIRCFDPDSRQVRDATVVQDFLPK